MQTCTNFLLTALLASAVIIGNVVSASAPVEVVSSVEHDSELLAQRNAELLTEVLQRHQIHLDVSTATDPMAVPFLIAPYIKEQLMAAFASAKKAENRGEILVLAEEIIKRFPDSEEAAAAKSFRDQIITPKPDSNELHLDSRVVTNLSAIIYDSESPMIMVGFDVLQVGDTIPGAKPTHVVKTIGESQVVITVLGETHSADFEISVQSR